MSRNGRWHLLTLLALSVPAVLSVWPFYVPRYCDVDGLIVASVLGSMVLLVLAQYLYLCADRKRKHSWVQRTRLASLVGLPFWLFLLLYQFVGEKADWAGLAGIPFVLAALMLAPWSLFTAVAFWIAIFALMTAVSW